MICDSTLVFLSDTSFYYGIKRWIKSETYVELERETASGFSGDCTTTPYTILVYISRRQVPLRDQKA